MGILDYMKRFFVKQKVYWYRDRIPSQITMVSLLRIRNESLIIEDTLRHHSEFSDAILCYDDASADETFDIISRHPKVVGIIRNYHWSPDPQVGIELETKHRQALLELGMQLNPTWFFCADADERYEGDIRGFIQSYESHEVDIIKIRLFDAYITPEDQRPYQRGQKLYGFRRFFGPERRDIVMMWRARNDIRFVGSDSREPTYPAELKVISMFYCQHYGKSLSIEHWEETCDYYVNHFPFDTYGKKWMERKGKAIHTKSDFGRELYEWGPLLFDNAVVIKP